MTQRTISHLHNGLSEGWGGSRVTLRLITSSTCGAAVRISASEKESQTSKNRNRENEPQEIIIKYRHILTRDSRSWTDNRQTKTLHADFYWFLPQQEERSAIMKDDRNIRHSYTPGHKAVIKRCFRRDIKDTDDVLSLTWTVYGWRLDHICLQAETSEFLSQPQCSKPTHGHTEQRTLLRNMSSLMHVWGCPEALIIKIRKTVTPLRWKYLWAWTLQTRHLRRTREPVTPFRI